MPAEWWRARKRNGRWLYFQPKGERPTYVARIVLDVGRFGAGTRLEPIEKAPEEMISAGQRHGIEFFFSPRLS